MKKISPKEYYKVYKEAFSTEAGQVVLADLVKKYRILSPFKMTDRKPGDLEFREGQRQVVLDILTKLNYDISTLETLKDFDTQINYGENHNAGRDHTTF